MSTTTATSVTDLFNLHNVFEQVLCLRLFLAGQSFTLEPLCAVAAALWIPYHVGGGYLHPATLEEEADYDQYSHNQVSGVIMVHRGTCALLGGTTIGRK